MRSPRRCVSSGDETLFWWSDLVSNGTFSGNGQNNVILRQRCGPEMTVEMLSDITRFENLIDDIVIGCCHIHGFAQLMYEEQLAVVS